MTAHGDMLIRVQSAWNSWRSADVRLGDLRDVHWFQPIQAPRALVHGYVSCSSIAAGEIPHDCVQKPGSHRLLVCVLKKHTIPTVYAELARRADQQLISPSERRAGAGMWRRSTPLAAGRR